jgi:hypothetical protein
MVDSSPGAAATVNHWDFEKRAVTLDELLRERVRREVEAFNRDRPVVFQGLVQPEESERLLNGYRLTRDRAMDWEKQYERAKKAFETNGFLVIAGGRQIESLTEEIDLEEAREVEFVKLVPLVGG